MIYFVQAERSGLIKIGYSTAVKARLRALQTGSPEPLRILALIEGSPEEEQAFHQRFAFARSHGEWFHPRRRLLEFIDSVANGEPVGATGYAVRRRRLRSEQTQRVRLEALKKAADEAGLSLHDFIASRVLPMSSDA